MTAQVRQAVGAGRGMSCFGLKGGIGTSSRLAPLPDGRRFTVGALVLANFGLPGALLLEGRRDPAAPMPAVAVVHEALLDPLFQAAAEATEQAIRNGLWHADTVAGRDGHVRLGLRDWLRDTTGA